MISRTLYKPLPCTQGRLWGEIRYQSGTLPTDYTYTGQYSHTTDFGLMYYVARWYDPYLNRFIQPDTIVPDAGNPQDYDRYSYVRNNPLRYTDPSGHFCYDADKNKYSDGDCFDDIQQQMLDYFIAQLESGDYTDLEIMENLLNYAFSLNSDPAIALRAATEMVRSTVDVPGTFGFEYHTQSKFYYEGYTNDRFDDSGFGDLTDTQRPNQISHFIGIAYIAAYQSRGPFSVDPDLLVWGNELDNDAPIKQDQIDRDLGYMAVDYGEALIANYGDKAMDKARHGPLDVAITEIQTYSYADAHPITNWWLTR